MPTPLSGDPILASDIKIPFFRNKSVAESVTSSTALQNDNDFAAIDLEAGKTYQVNLWMHVVGSAGASPGDIRLAWATTGTITALGRSGWGMAEGGTSMTSTQVRVGGHAIGTAVVYGCIDTDSTVVREEMMVTCTVAGQLTLQWAQGTSNVTSTTCSTASRIMITEVETL